MSWLTNAACVARKSYLVGAVTIAAAWALGAAISVTSVFVYAASDDLNVLGESSSSDAPLTSTIPTVDRAIRVASLH